jgi:hypothetical protein
MNERIKELAAQATRQYSPTYYTQEWIQGFAQLIVRECIRIDLENPDAAPGVEIAKHFGIN